MQRVSSRLLERTQAKTPFFAYERLVLELRLTEAHSVAIRLIVPQCRAFDCELTDRRNPRSAIVMSCPAHLSSTNRYESVHGSFLIDFRSRFGDSGVYTWFSLSGLSVAIMAIRS